MHDEHIPDNERPDFETADLSQPEQVIKDHVNEPSEADDGPARRRRPVRKAVLIGSAHDFDPTSVGGENGEVM